MSYKFNPFTGNLDFVGSSNEEVFSFPDISSFPPVGEPGKLYISESDNSSYYWNGTGYEKLNDNEVEFFNDTSNFPTIGVYNKLYITKSPFGIYQWNGTSYETFQNNSEKWEFIHADSTISPGNYMIENDNLTIILDDSYPIGSVWRIRHPGYNLTLQTQSCLFIEGFSISSVTGNNTYQSQVSNFGVDVIKISNTRLRIFPNKSLTHPNITDSSYISYNYTQLANNKIKVLFEFLPFIDEVSDSIQLPNFKTIRVSINISGYLNHYSSLSNETFRVSLLSSMSGYSANFNVNQTIEGGDNIALELEVILRHVDYKLVNVFKIITLSLYGSGGNYFDRKYRYSTLSIDNYLSNWSGTFKQSFLDLLKEYIIEVIPLNHISQSDVYLSLDYCEFKFFLS